MKLIREVFVFHENLVVLNKSTCILIFINICILYCIVQFVPELLLNIKDNCLLNDVSPVLVFIYCNRHVFCMFFSLCVILINFKNQGAD